MSLPAYTMGQVGLLDFAPIQNALGQAIQNRQFNQRNALDQQRMGMEQERLGFDRQRMEQEAKLAPLRLSAEMQRIQAMRDEFEFNRQHRPTQLATERERLAGLRDERTFKQEMHPYELLQRQAQIKALQQRDQKVMEVNGRIVRVNPDGTATELYNSGPNFDKLPEFAAKSAAFTTRMIDAERNIRETMLDPKKFDPTSITTAAVRLMPEGVGNYALRGKEHQRYMQAAEQWIRAFLRKESGAAIGKDEFARDFRVYFPQPGDSADVIAQKAQARLRAMQGFSGETRGFHQHVDPAGHGTLNEWLNPKVKKPPPIDKPDQVPTITNPEDAKKLGKGQRFIYNGQEYEVQ